MADARSRHARLLALAEILSPSLNGRSLHDLADVVELGVLDSEAALETLEGERRAWVAGGLAKVTSERVGFWRQELERLAEQGIWLLDASDKDYPVNLRMVHNRPAFLMGRGSLSEGDSRAIAIVGTRHASRDGLGTAYAMARGLAGEGVTVVSGLARGIDSAAHAGALSAAGRTLAVMGTGIEVAVTAGNRALANAIAGSGAYVSQFWPRSRGAQWTFPARNIVTSGLSVGTAVVEAGETSGARRQAEAAVLQGKRVFLYHRLVETQSWARQFSDRPGVSVMSSIDDLVTAADVDLMTETSALL